MKATNITNTQHLVSSDQRWRTQGHIGGVLWFTGLPASGKSTLAFGLELELFKAGFEVYAFGSQQIRQGLNKDLGFTREARKENIRRAGELAAIMASSGLIVITSFISPYAEDRAMARAAVGKNFHEVYLDTSLKECERRDKRGRYTKARNNRVYNFTGINAPFEVPSNPELALCMRSNSIKKCIEILVDYSEKNFRALLIT